MNVPQISIHPGNFQRGRGGEVIVAVVHHVMLGTLAGTIEAFRKPGWDASANYGIGLNGQVVQFVADPDTAYAHGNLRQPQLWIPWLKRCVDEGISPNACAISIEWEGRHDGGRWSYKTWTDPRAGVTIHKQVLVEPARWWTPTVRQYQAGLELVTDLCHRHQIPRTREHIGRHSDVDSVFKAFCPGAGFPMEQLLKDLNR